MMKVVAHRSVEYRVVHMAERVSANLKEFFLDLQTVSAVQR